MMSSCCPICYRVGIGVVEEGGWRDAEKSMKQKVELQQRFFRLLQRYLSEDDTKQDSESGVKKSKLRFPLDQLARIGMLPCEQCSKLMDSFSELYHQLKSIELLLNWRVETLHNVMSCDQRVPSRMEDFRTLMRRMELEGSPWGSVEEIMESVTNTRKYLIVKCSRKISTTFPKVSTAKWKSPEGPGIANGIQPSQPSGENEGSCSEHEPQNSSPSIHEDIAPDGDGGIIDAGPTDFVNISAEREENTNETVSFLSCDNDDDNLPKEKEINESATLARRKDYGNDLHNSTMGSGEDVDSTSDDDDQPMNEQNYLSETETEVQETSQFSSTLKSLLSYDTNIYQDGKLTRQPGEVDGAEKGPDLEVASPCETSKICHKPHPNREDEGHEKEICTEKITSKSPSGDEERRSDSQHVELEPEPASHSDAPIGRKSYSVSKFINTRAVAGFRLRPTYRCNYCKKTFSTNERLQHHVQVVHNDHDEVNRVSSDNDNCMFDDSDSDSDMCLVSSSSDEDSSSSPFRQLSSHSDPNSTSGDGNFSKDTIESTGPLSETLTERKDDGNYLHNSAMVSVEDDDVDSTNADDDQPMSGEHNYLSETKTEVQETPQISSNKKSSHSCDKREGKLSIPPEEFEIDRGNPDNIDGADKGPSTDLDVVSPCETNETCHKPHHNREDEGHEKEICTEKTTSKLPSGDEELHSDSQHVELEPEIASHLDAPIELKPCLLNSVSKFINTPEVAGFRLRSTYRCKYCKKTFSTNERLKHHVQVVHDDHDEVCRMSSDNDNSVVDGNDDSDSDSDMGLLSSDDSSSSSSSCRQRPSRSDPSSTSNKIIDDEYSDDNCATDDDDHFVSYTSLEEPGRDNPNSWYRTLKKGVQKQSYYRLKCPDCNGLFKSVHHLLIHRKNSNPCAASYDPTTCVKIEVLIPPGGEKKWSPKHSFKTVHAIIDLPQAIFICEVDNCGAALYSSEDLEAHKKLHGSFPCQFCDVKVTFAPNLAEHEFSKHSKRGSSRKPCCPRCDFTVLRNKSQRITYVHHHLGSHLSLVLNEPICGICKAHSCYLTRRQDRHAEHFKSMHDVSDVKNESVILRCPIGDCRAYFLNRSQLRSHLRRHHNRHLKVTKSRTRKRKHPVPSVEIDLSVPKTFKCKDCGQTFDGESGAHKLRLHRLKEHVDPFKVIPCAKCSKVFETAEQMKKHQVAHSAQFQKSRRVATIVDGKTFICEHCGKAFKNNGQLRIHYLYHSGPESWQFECDVCSKKCTTKGKLREHMQTHTKEMPFVCQICGLKYAYRHNLRNHVNSKHRKGAEAKPFVCEICGLKYAHPHNLRNHVKNKHGKGVEDKPGKANLRPRKGVKRKRRSNVESTDEELPSDSDTWTD